MKNSHEYKSQISMTPDYREELIYFEELYHTVPTYTDCSALRIDVLELIGFNSIDTIIEYCNEIFLYTIGSKDFKIELYNCHNIDELKTKLVLRYVDILLEKRIL